MAEGRGLRCLPDNFVSGGFSHVAVQLDVQRKPAHAKYKYPAVGVVKRPIPANSGISPARHYMAGIFVARRG